MVRRIHDALLGDFSSDNEGLVVKVRRHEGALKSLNRLAWIMVGAFVTAAITILVRGVM